MCDPAAVDRCANYIAGPEDGAPPLLLLTTEMVGGDTAAMQPRSTLMSLSERERERERIKEKRRRETQVNHFIYSFLPLGR